MAAEHDVRTAVVLVHGMGEQRPMETFDAFVRTALNPHDGKWDYQPRPAEVTETYEARRYAAPTQGTEFFEYHWPFLMTADAAAAIITRKITARARTIVVPWQFAVIRGLTGLLPRALVRWVLARA